MIAVEQREALLARNREIVARNLPLFNAFFHRERCQRGRTRFLRRGGRLKPALRRG